MSDNNIAMATVFEEGRISQRRSLCVLCGSGDVPIVVALNAIPIVNRTFRSTYTSARGADISRSATLVIVTCSTVITSTRPRSRPA
jgi:hypothetical protein